jgi:hypothetical protein
MTKHTIVLKNYLNIYNEYDAASAITPGELLEVTSAGKVQAHSSGGGAAIKMFAVEDELQGKDIDEDYAADDPLQVWFPTPGDEVNAILADGQNVDIGDFLVSNGDGTLKAYGSETAPNAIVAQALEALDLSDSSGGESSGALGYDKRIEVRIV